MDLDIVRNILKEVALQHPRDDDSEELKALSDYQSHCIGSAGSTPPDRQHVVSGETVLLSIRHRRDKTMAGYAQVTLVGVDLDHVTTSRHDPQAAEYGGTVTLRARSQGIDFTYAYPFSNRTSVLDAIDGATKSLLSELDSLSRACMDVTRQERDAIDEGDQDTEGPGDDL